MAIKAHLAWLRGYPLRLEQHGVRWQPFPDGASPEPLLVDRDRIRRAVATVTKLTRRERMALEAEVSDREAWEQEQRTRLEALQALVHRRESPNDLLSGWTEALSKKARERAMRLSRSPVKPLIEAFQWIHRGSLSNDLASVLDTIERHRESLRAILLHDSNSLGPLLHLVTWMTKSPSGAPEAFLDFLALRDLPCVPTSSMRPYLTQCENMAAELLESSDGDPMPEWPEWPRTSWFFDLLSWTLELAALDHRSRNRALEIFLLALPRDLPACWRLWRDELERCHHELKARRRTLPTKRRSLRRKERRAFSEPLRQLGGRMPNVVPEWLLPRISEIAERPRQAEATCRLLAALPEDEGGSMNRLAFLEAPSTWLKISPERECLEIRELARTFAEGTDTRRRLELWQRSSFLPESLLCVQDTTTRRVCTAALELVFANEEASGTWIDRSTISCLIRHTEATKDAQWAFEATAKLVAADEKNLPYLATTEIRVRYALARGSVDLYVAITLAIARSPNTAEVWEAETPRLVTELRKAAWIDRAAHWFAQGRQEEFARVELQLRALRKLGHEDLPRPRSPRRSLRRGTADWIEACPEALREDVTRFASVDPEAESRVRKLLGVHFHDPAAWRRELEVLVGRERRGEGKSKHHLERRIESLRARLREPPVPSPRKLERWSRELRDRTLDASLEHWRREVERRFLEEFVRHAGLAEAPPWLLEDRVLSVLPAFFDLGTASRKLALRILRSRALDPPWDLRDHPANRAFLSRMRSRGLVIEPWLEGIPAERWSTRSGQSFAIALEDDPLDIFHMGRHFQTCLSPGAFNFFSVISNIADINKRVVYGRDRKGTVIGRCLFALTSSGHLLTFHRYQHDHEHGFEEHLRSFARRLAEACGTELVGSGDVEHLVANDWYDDGSHDLVRRFPALENGAAFRAELKHMEGPTFRERVRAEFDMEVSNPLVLPLLLELPEVRGNADILRDLMPILLEASHLPSAPLRRVASDLCGHDRPAEARALLERLARRSNSSTSDGLEMALVWARLAEPARALEALRRTRPTGVRGWVNERDPDRLLCAAEAHVALGRRAKAIELLDRASRHDDLSRGAQARARERMEEIASELAR